MPMPCRAKHQRHLGDLIHHLLVGKTRVDFRFEGSEKADAGLRHHLLLRRIAGAIGDARGMRHQLLDGDSTVGRHGRRTAMARGVDLLDQHL